jgi:sec-independent protein translocase protein TatB
MFGIGFGELLLIAVVGFLVIGPKKLPDFMRTLAVWYRQFLDLRDEIRFQLTHVPSDDQEPKLIKKAPLESVEKETGERHG